MKNTIMPDVSNVAGHFNVFPPKVENIDLMYNRLKYEYWILGIADWKLFSVIDYREAYRTYITRRIIIEAPPDIPADKLMIELAIKRDWLIITNDKFEDHKGVLVSESWIKLHRVPFEISEGKFIIHLPKSVE